MGLIDSHAHITYAPLIEDIDAVMASCADAGVDAVITVGTSVPEIHKGVELARRFADRVFVAAGIHPHEAGKTSEADIAELPLLWQQPEVVALGEMGLDYHYDFADREAQHRIFAAQLEHAARVDKPIVIHSRDALDDTVHMLVEHGFEGRRVVFHCFTGTATEAAIIAQHGWRISFTGIVTFKKSRWLQDIARTYPGDQIMVETDSPYLSPEPVRGAKPCEPSFVAHTARYLASLRDVDYGTFVEQSSQNTRNFFNLPRIAGSLTA